MTFREEKLAIGLPLSDRQGTQYWFKEGTDGVLHREGDLPAIEHADGGREWWVNGQRHRGKGLPAIIRSDGTREWWVRGGQHREVGPAAIYPDGSEEWFLNGKRHRVGGPATVWQTGDKTWWVDGKRHREDGPAAIRPKGKDEWFVRGVKLEGETLEAYCKAISLATPGIVLGELSRHAVKAVSFAAVHSPNCPVEDQVEWALAQH